MEKDKNKFDISKYLLCQSQLVELYRKKFTSDALACKISKPEADVLVFLVNNPTQNTARDIVQYRGFSKGYVSKAVELLLEKELVLVTTSKSDRRYQHIEITAKATKIVQVLKRSQHEFVQMITSGLEESDTQCFGRIVEQVLKNLPQENAVK